MPSSTTWWWIGIGAGTAAAVGVGGYLVYRGREPAPLGGPLDPGLFAEPFGAAPPPVPEPEPEPAISAFTARDPYESTRIALCRKWTNVEDAPRQTPLAFEIRDNAVAEQIARINPKWSTQEELETKTFLVTRDAIGSICPNVRLPDTEASLSLMQQNDWFRAMWGQFSSTAYRDLYAYKQ